MAAPDFKLEITTLTPKQTALWDEVRNAFIWHTPAFASLLYSMMAKSSDAIAYFSKQVPIAATDGRRLILNPDTFFSSTYTLGNRVFIVAHEVCHAMLAHCEQIYGLEGKSVTFTDGTSAPYHEHLMGIAADYIINDILFGSEVGILPAGALRNPRLISGNDTLFDAYKKLCLMWPEQPEVTGGQFDRHLPPGSADGICPSEAVAQRDETEWRVQTECAMSGALARGKLPAALHRFLKRCLEPKVEWTEYLRQSITRKLGQDRRSWRRLDRKLIVRGIGAPCRTGFGCNLVVVAIDTSGSINDKTISRFLSEVAGILDDVRPQAVTIMWCDAEVNRIDEVCDTSDLEVIHAEGVMGGGGTDFTPVFDRVRELGLEPDTLLYLTDMYGSFPQEEPDYPVIWGSVSDVNTSPFGDVVLIPQQAV